MLLTIEPGYGVSEEESGAERRRGLRIRQQRPVKAFDPVGCRFLPGHTEDISSSGMRVHLPASAPLRAGSPISIHVGVAASGQPLANRRDMMPARVIWTVRQPDSRYVLVGVELTGNTAAQLDAA